MVIRILTLFVSTATVTLAGCGAGGEYPQENKIHAVRTIIAWIVEDKAIPSVEPYGDAVFVNDKKRICVVCEFLPPDVSLSSDPRIERVTKAEMEAIYEEHGFEDIDYIDLTLGSQTHNELRLGGSNSFAGLGGHGFFFTFRLQDGELTVEGGITWVS